jgi:ArsR family transcriptional regulator, virulence genes transcriptional regulator
MDPNQLQRRAREASELLKALGNAHRLMILCQLLEGEKSVGELVRTIGLSQSALSQHLARLRRDRLVSTRRSAQTIYYTLAGAEARALLQTLHGLYCGRELVEAALERNRAAVAAGAR